MAFGIKRNATDALFSNYIRELAKWQCERCFRSFDDRRDIFDCSHFYSRKNRSVRFDPENAAALCRGCHLYFGERPLEHAEFFLKRLGRAKLDALRLRAHNPIKVDEKAISVGLKAALEGLRKNSQVFGKR